MSITFSGLNLARPANFKPDDWLAVVAINRKTGETVQRVSPARSMVSPEYQRWLRYLNATGSDVYMSSRAAESRGSRCN